MLIQNLVSNASAQGLASDSAPVAVPQPKAAAAEAPQPANRPATEQKPAPMADQVQSAVNNINKAMRQNNSNVEFSIDHDTGRTLVKVVESQTGEVIRQMPSEDVLAISRAIDHMQQRGLLLKQEA